MRHPNLELINRFFAAYGNHDRESLRMVLAEHATWTFPGHHPLSGVKVGIDAIVTFFDAMGSIMGSSNVNVEQLITGVNEQYVVECQHIRTNRAAGPNLDQQLCVLWGFEQGKMYVFRFGVNRTRTKRTNAEKRLLVRVCLVRPRPISGVVNSYGKIVSGRHLTADQDALDAFYTALLEHGTEHV